MKRAETLAGLQRLPRAATGTIEESLDFIETQSLSGHPLWTLDARLAAAATKLRIGYQAR